VLRLFGLGPKPLAPQVRLKLPEVSGWADVVMIGDGPRGPVCVESLNDRGFTVGALRDMKPGGTGVFSYDNATGRFRFSARCLDVRGHSAVFALPERIETLQVFAGAHQRAAVRLDATLPAQWRFAPNGRGSGDYVRGSLTDLSRSGASLIVDREVKNGSFVETRFAVSTAATPLVVLAEVVRNSAIESSKKVSLGLRFHGLKAEDDRAITDYINKRQADRRHRGLG
jgi:PilZ domain